MTNETDRGSTVIARVLLLATAMLSLLWVGSKGDAQSCKQRSDVIDSRLETIKADARSHLRIGAKRPDIVRFFSRNDIPLEFVNLADQPEAMGAIAFGGIRRCGQSGCGDDATMINVRIDVDDAGTVVGEPVIYGILTNCP